MSRRWVLTPLVAAQAVLGARVLWRLARTAGGDAIGPSDAADAPAGPDDRVAIVLPVLNEADRLARCLDGLIAQGDCVEAILVVDGGSDDETRDIARGYARRDPRLRLIEAGAAPADWNGKVWNLQAGLDQARAPWVLMIDADVRAAPRLAGSLVAHARRAGLDALSVATRQEVRGAGEGLIHPALLTTLVYRFGIPGSVIRRVSEAQANGQCFLARRAVLLDAGGFRGVRESICEDITIARRLVAGGYRLGFFEAGDLVSVRMYPDWRATWRNWPRSLPMRDRYFGPAGVIGLLEVLLVQALPLPLLLALRLDPATPGWMRAVNRLLVATRFGVLAGTARAYVHRPWSYWLSPLADLPVAIKLCLSAAQREHRWRGRVIVRGDRGGGGD